MRLPQALVATWSHESEWLAELPHLVADCAQEWSLELEAPIETPYSLVVPAGDTVLKLTAPSDAEGRHEADALALWRGGGAVRLLQRDDERHAFLIERCVPGTRLWDVDVDEIDVICELIPRLQIEAAEASQVPALADAAERWADVVPRWYAEAGAPFARGGGGRLPNRGSLCTLARQPGSPRRQRPPRSARAVARDRPEAARRRARARGQRAPS